MSERKFKLTTESKINAWYIELFRIEATVDFRNGDNEIKKGDKGGWIEKESNLSGDAWVYDNAEVYDNAKVYGDAEVSGNAWVSGNAKVYGDAEVSGNAKVYGDAEVYGDAWVSGDAKVYGDAWVSGNAKVYGDAKVSGDAKVYGDAKVSGDAEVSGDAKVSGNASLAAKSAYTKGKFVGGDDSETPKFTNITDKTGSNYWKNQYVIGDYEISEIEQEVVETAENQPEIITLNGKRYKVID